MAKIGLLSIRLANFMGVETCIKALKENGLTGFQILIESPLYYIRKALQCKAYYFNRVRPPGVLSAIRYNYLTTSFWDGPVSFL
jgi:hypothetical protein